ncbi:hypothetical protein QTP70_003544 [Hemibagrus guttatus]|uniref:ribonuclease H n=1 Tax=Hemibagrus guttatus TaxID=175788 RepID=A0AAE0VAI0_9TELE|nr:hypothetical protein QTP70_003544 [Hemibagrus guttatus]
MERRKVDILCVQETRWKGSKARSIGAGFKLFYYGVDSKRNGVGVVLKKEFVRNVLEVNRVSDRVMSLKLEIEGMMLNVVSGYAPQVGCELEEKERFWSELDEVMESIPTGERVVIGVDFNGHVGEGNTGDKEVMGKFGVKERNLEGQMVVDFAKRMDMAVANTYFQKREEHRVTYKSRGRRTQVDYILCRRGNLKEISDCKVVVGESVARQHRMVVCRMTLLVCKMKRSKIEIEKKTKWWKLKKEECCEEFRQKLRQALGGQVVMPDDWETTAEVIRETGRKVLGVSSGRRKEDKETWWWNEEVQDGIQRKRLAKRKWDMDRTEENRQEYKELQHRVKREVSKAKQKAYDELYTREKDLYKLARQRDRDGKDVQQVRVIKDRDGRVLTSEESVQRRWKEYFEELMNEENEREKRVEGVQSYHLPRCNPTTCPLDPIPSAMLQTISPDLLPFITTVINGSLTSGHVPTVFKKARVIPILKKPALDPSDISNYRPNNRHDPNQSGFKAAHSTETALLAVTEKLRAARSAKLSSVFILLDLSAAFDTVNQKTLLSTLRSLGICGTAWEWFASYLDGCSYQLKLNPSKTDLLIIPGDPSPAQDLAISLSNYMISPSATARNLGVTMDNQLSFSSHVTNVTRSCRFLLYNNRRIRPFLSTQATQVLVQSLVISRLDYCNSLLAGLPLNAIHPLQMIQNAAARLVFNLPKFSHTTPLLCSLHWLPVTARIRFKTLMLAYKAKNGPAPSYLKALITPRTAPRSLRSTSTARLVPPSLREKDLEKAYDRVPREELWYCMRKSGVAEKNVRVVQDMYERSRTVVRCAVGQTEEFKVEVGLHQGSALSPFLFAIVMDQLSEEVRQESPWTMMFADDIVICSESREQVEENLERWRFALERRGMKVSHIQSNGECGKEVKKRVQAETVSLRKRQESELEVAELKMLRSQILLENEISIFKKLVRRRGHEVLQNFLVNRCSDLDHWTTVQFFFSLAQNQPLHSLHDITIHELDFITSQFYY